MKYDKADQVKKTPTKKVKTLDIAQLKRKAQKMVNKYVRERDKDLPCISCGKMKEDKDAGHYIAQGSSGFLRYNLDNLHGQCLSCNRFKHGNLLEYRINLIKKIGKERVEYLEENRRQLKKWTREELDELCKLK